MSVKDTLDKIVERHPDVIGAMVLADGQVYHNLETPYDVISVDMVLETLTEVFENTMMLEDEGHDFTEVMIDFANHSLIVRTIEDGVLAVLAPRLQRGQLVKLHVGLGIFAKAVQKAISEEPEVSEPEIVEEAAAVAEEPVAEPIVEDRVTSAVAPRNNIENVDAADPLILGIPKRSKRGGLRRTRDMLAGRFGTGGEDAVSEPQPKEPSGDITNEDGVPLNADGTPKTKKMYRGQVYYE